MHVGPFLFLGRAINGVEAIVVGDYLYIDGGERCYTPNGTATCVPGVFPIR